MTLLALVAAAGYSAAGLPWPAAGQETAPACYRFDLGDVETSVRTADVIVIGTVDRADGQQATVIPVAFLKGRVSAAAISLTRGDDGSCPEAVLTAGERVLVVLAGPGEQQNAWPGPSQVFTLQDGQATNQDDPPSVVDETELIERIRAVTGQYAVPPAGPGEGASVEWWSTMVPVGLALVLLFGVGLVLMRIWHRIDPT